MRINKALVAAVAASLVSGGLIASAQVPGINSPFQMVYTYAFDNATNKATYGAAVNNLNPISTAALSDVVLVQGSATKLVRIRRVKINGIASIAAHEDVTIAKRSSSPSGGVGSVVASQSYDSTAAAATAVVESYTTPPVVGTLVGEVASAKVFFGNLTTTASGPQTPSDFYFGAGGSALILRGTSEWAVVNLENRSIINSFLNITVEFTEE